MNIDKQTPQKKVTIRYPLAQGQCLQKPPRPPIPIKKPKKVTKCRFTVNHHFAYLEKFYEDGKKKLVADRNPKNEKIQENNIREMVETYVAFQNKLRCSRTFTGYSPMVVNILNYTQKEDRLQLDADLINRFFNARIYRLTHEKIVIRNMVSLFTALRDLYTIPENVQTIQADITYLISRLDTERNIMKAYFESVDSTVFVLREVLLQRYLRNRELAYNVKNYSESNIGLDFNVVGFEKDFYESVTKQKGRVKLPATSYAEFRDINRPAKYPLKYKQRRDYYRSEEYAAIGKGHRATYFLALHAHFSIWSSKIDEILVDQDFKCMALLAKKVPEPYESIEARYLKMIFSLEYVLARNLEDLASILDTELTTFARNYRESLRMAKEKGECMRYEYAL